MSIPRRTTALLTLSLFAVSLVVLSGCGGSGPQKSLTAEQRFEEGKKRFDDHDYLEAANDFEIIRLQFPGSAFADQAQFYLGECHFAQEEYLLAAEEYATLKRTMPASPLVPMAQYKIALCYYSLSPRPSLDQVYTTRAIDEFQSFIEYYPKHEKVPDAEAKIAELNGRLAKKLFESAELYMKMNYLKAAIIYYSAVIEKYHDSPYAEPAMIGKVRALVARRKYTEAQSELEKYLEKYPQGAHRADADGLRKEIEDHLKSGSALLTPPQGRGVRSPKGAIA